MACARCPVGADACDECLVDTITRGARSRYPDATVTVTPVTRVRRGVRAWRVTVERRWLADLAYNVSV